jgi:hypothetical protein
MLSVRWRLNDILKANNLTAYKLEQAVRGNVSRNTIYRWARETPQLLDLGALPFVVEALTRLTGQAVTPNDLLEVIEAPEVPEMDDETKDWLEMAGTDTMKAIHAIEKDVSPEKLARWHKSMQSAGKPAKYVVGKGIVLLEGKA